MHKKVTTDLNFIEREKDILNFWKENNIFNKMVDHRKDGKDYTFYDGPPTANGQPHIGHVLTRVVKDIIPRYRTMKGYNVLRKAGWDTHGLPVELEVEKRLGIDGKEQIEEYGLEPFIEECKKSVWKYKGMWEDFSDRVAYWADMEDPYITYENDYIESIWWALKQIYDKGLLYKGFKVVPYCPRCGTPLSSHEVAQGYKDVKEKSITAKFKVKGTDNEYFLAWTTTPWTLPSNVALCVNPREAYVKISVKVDEKEEKYILAEELLSIIPGDYKVEETFIGADLEYKEYEPLFNYGDFKKKAYYVTCDNFVTLTDGTGIVHIAPAFGEDDSLIGRTYDLPFLQLVDDKGEFKEEATDFAGMFCKDADEMIMKLLYERGLLFEVLPFEHTYPFCWRCDTPLIYYARESWFVEMTKVKDDLVANNEKINWLPETIGKGRFGDWLANVQDWAISRDRYWGTPLNIWECEDEHRHAIGSIEELKAMSDNCPDEIELHIPFIDKVTIKCPECGKEMKRVKPVIDCWFDSGAMPFAQWHYPFENHKEFKDHFPADFISEAVDQTRGWFYSLHAISTLLFNAPAFKNVIVMGHVQDEDGQKMSKSKGNAVEPMETLGEHGADAVRWYFSSNSALYLPSRYSDKAVTEGQRKFMGTFWNTYAFYILYANIDKFDATKHSLDIDSLSVMDKWLLSKLNTTVKEVDNYLDNYKIIEGARLLNDFVDDLSNWYVRRSRERFWAKGLEQDKINAYMTLYTTLLTLAKVSASYIPYMTEEIYQNLVVAIDDDAKESIFLCDFPSYDENLIDKELEKNMEAALKVVVLGRACRNTANIKNRQPIGKMFVKADFKFKNESGELENGLAKLYTDIIEDELNIKEVIYTEDVREFTTYIIKPLLNVLGPKYGKQIGQIRQELSKLDGNKVMDELNEVGKLKLELKDETISIGKDELLIESTQKESYISDSNNGVTVVVDTTLSKELIEEGFVREIISKIQTMRKDADFEVMDRIIVFQKANNKIKEIMENNAEEIKSEVLADEIILDDSQGYSKEWNLNGEDVVLSVKKASISCE